MGFTVGLAQHSQSGILFVQSELLYNRKGSEYILGSFRVDANLDYVQVPVSIGVGILATPLNVYTGGYAAFLLKADYKYNVDDQVVATYDKRDACNPLDLGVHLGVSFDLDIILFDIRFSRGLLDVEDEDIITSLETCAQNDTNNYNVELTAGYFF